MSRNELKRLGGDILGDQTARDKHLPESSKRAQKRAQRHVPERPGKKPKQSSDDDEVSDSCVSDSCVSDSCHSLLAGVLAVCNDREDQEQNGEQDLEHD